MSNRIPQALIVALLAAIVFTSSTTSAAQTQTGLASYYHDSLHGRKTASGQIYDKHKVSVAHKTLPLGTKVKVTDVKTGRSIVARVNDRGPFVKGRIVDLSRKAAASLGMIRKGVARVKVEVLSAPKRRGI